MEEVVDMRVVVRKGQLENVRLEIRALFEQLGVEVEDITTLEKEAVYVELQNFH
jgi:hypothetical protein